MKRKPGWFRNFFAFFMTSRLCGLTRLNIKWGSPVRCQVNAGSIHGGSDPDRLDVYEFADAKPRKFLPVAGTLEHFFGRGIDRFDKFREKPYAPPVKVRQRPTTAYWLLPTASLATWTSMTGSSIFWNRISLGPRGWPSDSLSAET